MSLKQDDQEDLNSDDDGDNNNNNNDNNNDSNNNTNSPPKKRPKTPYLPHHQINYGIAPYKYNDVDGSLESVICLFCQCFGREQNPNVKRRATQKVGIFAAPFRCDKYVQHHNISHKARWEQYQSLSESNKRTYFEGYNPDDNAAADDGLLLPTTVTAAGGSGTKRNRGRPPKVSTAPTFAAAANSRSLKFRFDPDIVEVILGDLLHDPKDDPPQQQQQRQQQTSRGAARANNMIRTAPTNKALSIFDCRENEETASIYYAAIIPQSLPYYHVITFLGKPGISKETCAELLLNCQHLNSTGTLSPPSSSFVLDTSNMRQRLVAKVMRYSRFAVAQNYQALQQLLQTMWGYSLVVDTSHHEVTGYVDVGMMVFLGGSFSEVTPANNKSSNNSDSNFATFHIIAFPSFPQSSSSFGIGKRSQAQTMVDLLSRILQVLDPSWQQKVLTVLQRGQAANVTTTQVHEGHSVVVRQFVQLLKRMVADVRTAASTGQDDDNNNNNNLPTPPLCPSELAQQWTEEDLSNLLQAYQGNLSLFYVQQGGRSPEQEGEEEEEDMDENQQQVAPLIMEEFQQFYNGYHHLESSSTTDEQMPPSWRTSLDLVVAAKENSTQRPSELWWFERTWNPLKKEFPHLYQFFGMLATTRGLEPSQQQTEQLTAGFRWTKPPFSSFQRDLTESKDEHQPVAESSLSNPTQQASRALIDFTLEASLQCRQYQTLQQYKSQQGSGSTTNAKQVQ